MNQSSPPAEGVALRSCASDNESTFLSRAGFLAGTRALEPMLTATPFVFHGVVLSELDSIWTEGLRTIQGKCSFSLDPAYTIRKYATLGHNSRHRYGPTWTADVQQHARKLNIEGSEAYGKILHDWEQSADHTALLVLATGDELLRPGVGSCLWQAGRTIYGGLSKWLHFHLGLFWDMTSGEWHRMQPAALRWFVAQQDERYDTDHMQRLPFRERNREELSASRTFFSQPRLVPPDRIPVAVRPTPQLRELMALASCVPSAVSPAALAEILSQSSNCHRTRSGFENWLPLAHAMLGGVMWGSWIVTVRRLLLWRARKQGISLVKSDAPGGVWQPLLPDDSEAARELAGAESVGVTGEPYFEEYRRRCLNVLRTGWPG